jgi:UDP-N-acetylglucosamine 2-epimerase
MKITTIIGARPQFIKAVAISKAFAQSNNIEEIIIHTGIVRNDTEWIELVDADYAALTGYKQSDIIDIVNSLLNKKMSFCEKFYGDGNTAHTIITQLLNLQ